MIEIWTDKDQYFTGEASINYGDAFVNGDVCTIKSIEINDIEIQLENNEPYLYGTGIAICYSITSMFTQSKFEIKFKSKKPINITYKELEDKTKIYFKDIKILSATFLEFYNDESDFDWKVEDLREIHESYVNNWIRGNEDHSKFFDNVYPNTIKEIKNILISELLEYIDITKEVHDIDNISTADFPHIINPYLKEYVPEMLDWDWDDYCNYYSDSVISALIKDGESNEDNQNFGIVAFNTDIDEIFIDITWTEHEFEDLSDPIILYKDPNKGE